MPDYSKPEEEKSPRPSEDIQIPPIPKQTTGAVTGAAIGSIAGPTGALVGGVIGALVGKAAADGGYAPRVPQGRDLENRLQRRGKSKRCVSRANR